MMSMSSIFAVSSNINYWDRKMQTKDQNQKPKTKNQKPKTKNPILHNFKLEIKFGIKLPAQIHFFSIPFK